MQLYITNDTRQLQMDKHNYYFAYFIIYFDRHTSHKILEMVFVRYVLFKDELIFKIVAIFVQKGRLNLATRCFSLN